MKLLLMENHILNRIHLTSKVTKTSELYKNEQTKGNTQILMLSDISSLCGAIERMIKLLLVGCFSSSVYPINNCCAICTLYC